MGCPRRAVTSAAWCLHCSTWCGPRCFWSGGRGGELSWHTSGGHWTHLPNPWRNQGLSSGLEKLNLCLFPSFFLLTVSCRPFQTCSLSPWAGSEALQSHYRVWGVLLSTLAEASVQVAGQPAHMYALYLLCLPGHAHLLWAAGQSVVRNSFFYASCLYKFSFQKIKISSSCICSCLVGPNNLMNWYHDTKHVKGSLTALSIKTKDTSSSSSLDHE